MSTGFWAISTCRCRMSWRAAFRLEAKTHAVDDVVQTALECGQQVVTGDAGQRCDALEVFTELLFADAIDPLDLLLFAKLLRVL
jgi:hypothetical protein